MFRPSKWGTAAIELSRHFFTEIKERSELRLSAALACSVTERKENGILCVAMGGLRPSLFAERGIQVIVFFRKYRGRLSKERKKKKNYKRVKDTSPDTYTVRAVCTSFVLCRVRKDEHARTKERRERVKVL